MRKISTEARPSQQACRRQRSGSIFPIFVVSLLLVAATAAVLTRTTLAQRALVRSDNVRLQGDWLVHSAAARATAKLNADATYSGETWNVSAGQLGQPYGATIRIAVSAIDEETDRGSLNPDLYRRIDLTVTVPAEGRQQVHLTRQILTKVTSP